MKTRTTAVAVALTGLAAPLADCGTGTRDNASDADRSVSRAGDRRTRCPGVLTDNAAASTLAVKAGAKAVNADGGVLGRKVEVTMMDDTGYPKVAVTKLGEAITSGKKPDLIVDSGPSRSRPRSCRSSSRTASCRSTSGRPRTRASPRGVRRA